MAWNAPPGIHMISPASCWSSNGVSPPAPASAMAAYLGYHGLCENDIKAPSKPLCRDVKNNQNAATPCRWSSEEARFMDHQNNSADPNKQRCCATCQPLLSNAALNSAGACHIHNITACRSEALIGDEMPDHHRR